MSSQSQQILLTAVEMTSLAKPEFLLVRKVVAVDATHLYTLRVKVDISLPVTFRLGNTFFINSPPKSSEKITGMAGILLTLQQRLEMCL